MSIQARVRSVLGGEQIGATGAAGDGHAAGDASPAPGTRDGPLRESMDAPRTLALAAVALSLAAPLQVLYHFIDVVGVPLVFLLVVAGTALAGVALARVLPAVVAVAIGALLLAAGLAWYVLQLQNPPGLLVLAADTFELLAGRSLLRIDAIRAWVLGVAPAPVFLTTYFAVRRNYVAAVAVAGGTLGFLVLTGDARTVATVWGVVAGTVAVGLGDLERRGESVPAAETLLVVAGVMIAVPWLFSIVPAAAGAPTGLVPDPGGDGTLESAVVEADERLRVAGSIELSPKVRFTVESDAPAKWRVQSFDRYTGDGWVRTGGLSPLAETNLDAPPGPTRTVTQRYHLVGRSTAAPAAWRPTAVLEGPTDSLSVTRSGSLMPGERLPAGTNYTVRSEVPAAGPATLQRAGTAYPTRVTDRYTQLPDSTPQRVARRTERLTANAETPYETALVIERWLRNNRAYSLDVRRPRGNVADAFLFEMDRGYCTYYATTMVAMLRTQDVPARFVTGYTTGQRTGGDEWVVRGLNSHAWVEVYFPEVGWVSFDPTPPGDRTEQERERVREARAANESNVDTSESAAEPLTPEPTPTPEPLTPTPGPGSVNATPPDPQEIPGFLRNISTPEDVQSPTPTPGAPGPGPRLPGRRVLGLGLVAVVGTAVGIRRTRAAERAYRAVWLRIQPRRDPETDVEVAFRRVMHHVERTSVRRRGTGETVRAYLNAVDAPEEARRVAALRERLRYGGTASEAAADEAVGLANDLLQEW